MGNGAYIQWEHGGQWGTGGVGHMGNEVQRGTGVWGTGVWGT